MALLHRVRNVSSIAFSQAPLRLPIECLLARSAFAAIGLALIILSRPGLDASRGAEGKGGTEAAPRASEGIQPLDLLNIRAAGTIVDQPIDGVFLVEPDGTVALGPAYGRVEVKCLAMEQAEIVIRKQLRHIVREPEVQVTAAGRVAKWRSGEPPKAPYRIGPDDLLRIQVLGTLRDQPIDGDYLVEPSGKIPLGPAYGRVAVKGLTVEEAEPVIKEHLGTVLREPHVSVTLAGWTSDLHLGTSLERKMAELDLQIRIAKGEVLATMNARKELEATIKELRIELATLRKNHPAPPRGGPAEDKE